MDLIDFYDCNRTLGALPGWGLQTSMCDFQHEVIFQSWSGLAVALKRFLSAMLMISCVLLILVN